VFDIQNKTSVERQIKDFKSKALIDKYCECFQRALDIFQNDPEFIGRPDPRNIFKKLSYENWENNRIENFYLSPLQKKFYKMRTDLVCLFSIGIDHWSVPLNKNLQLHEDVIEVVKAELIAERLLGDPLKRDQLNFAFNVLQIVYDANE